MIKVNDFASELCKRYGLSPDDATAFINDMFDVMKEELSATDSSVKIKGLGTFKVSAVGARASVDVNTGERIIIDGRNKITFTPELLLRDRVNRPFVQFETVVLNDGVDFSELDNEEPLEDDDVESDAMEETTDVTASDVAEEAADMADGSSDLTGDSSDLTGESDNVTEDTETQEPEPLSEEAPQEQNPSQKEASQEPEQPSDEASQQDVEPDKNPARAMARQLMTRKDVVSGDDESDDDDDDEYDGIVCKQRNPRMMYVLTVASFLLLVSLGIGMYFLYMRIEEKNNVIGKLETRLCAQVDSTPQADNLRQMEKVKVVADSASATADKASSVDKADKADGTRGKSKDSVSVAPMSSTSPSDYNYDVRVRTGAYIIVGVARTVTVQSGQTLSSVSKAYLGEGMECYVEVLNNCKQAKAGDKLKIPQLKLKPRRR